MILLHSFEETCQNIHTSESRLLKVTLMFSRLLSGKMMVTDMLTEQCTAATGQMTKKRLGQTCRHWRNQESHSIIKPRTNTYFPDIAVVVQQQRVESRTRHISRTQSGEGLAVHCCLHFECEPPSKLPRNCMHEWAHACYNSCFYTPSMNCIVHAFCVPIFPRVFVSLEIGFCCGDLLVIFLNLFLPS